MGGDRCQERGPGPALHGTGVRSASAQRLRVFAVQLPALGVSRFPSRKRGGNRQARIDPAAHCAVREQHRRNRDRARANLHAPFAHREPLSRRPRCIDRRCGTSDTALDRPGPQRGLARRRQSGVEAGWRGSWLASFRGGCGARCWVLTSPSGSITCAP